MVVGLVVIVAGLVVIVAGLVVIVAGLVVIVAGLVVMVVGLVVMVTGLGGGLRLALLVMVAGEQSGRISGKINQITLCDKAQIKRGQQSEFAASTNLAGIQRHFHKSMVVSCLCSFDEYCLCL